MAGTTSGTDEPDGPDVLDGLDGPDGLESLGAAGEVLRRLRAASVARSVDAMRRLHAADAVQEFPFAMPGVPARLVGRDAIVAFAAAAWRSPLRYERYRTVLAHRTEDPDTVVVQQDVHGTSSVSGPFVLPNLVVLTVAGDEVRHYRDFVHVPAAAAALGPGFELPAGRS